jgi:hypothetical protein
MKAKTKRPNSAKLTPGVTTATFEPGCYFALTELGIELPERSEEIPQKKPLNGKAGGVKKTGALTHDRRRLKQIEVFLNNCLNLAAAIETKRAAKIVQLLREARELAIHVRG